MKFTWCVLLSFLATTSKGSPVLDGASRSSHLLHIDNGNANSIFNSVLNSMRQFGASLHHNGMSMFLAHVPQGTEFYHGNWSDVPPTGIDWLAFEPEHALFFARIQRKPDPRSMQIQPTPSRRHVRGDSQHALRPFASRNRNHDTNDGGETNSSDLGYLHTYRLKSALRLIYLDGQSAAKTTKGTLDTQEAVILDPAHVNSPLDRDRGPEMCAKAAEKWNGEVHGFVRMEFGFEIMLCSFKSHLEVVSINTVSDGWRPPWFDQDMMDEIKSIASRYDDIGAKRVTLDFDTMINLHAYRDMVFINSAGLPRVNNQSSSLGRVRSDLDTLASGNFTAQIQAQDWQAIGDMYVKRYSDRIQHISSGHFRHVSDLRYLGVQAMRPFTNAGSRDKDEEVSRCATQYFPPDAMPTNAKGHQALSVAGRAVRTVALRICTTFSELRSADSVSKARADMAQLQRWLGWASFKRCRGCAVDEVCSLPIWPLLGYKADAEQPRCRSHLEFFRGRENYWWEPHWMD